MRLLFIFLFLFYFYQPSFSFQITQFTQNLCISENDRPILYYRVRKGDSLWKIAKKFKLSIKALKKLNELKDILIHPGEILKVRALPEKKVYGEFKTVIKKQYYFVKKGDSLWKIAKKFHTTIKKLKELNHIKGNLINPRQKLLIRIYKEKRFVRKYIVHRVQKGENLFKIAVKYGVSVEELKRFNGIKKSFLIRGQLIKIPLPISCSAFKIYKNLIREYGDAESLFSPDLGIGPLTLNQKEKEELKKVFLSYASLYKNYRYKYGGTGRNGYIDCSMFTKLVFKHLGIELPRTAREQYRIGLKVTKDELIPGDLVFFRTKKKNYPAHVGIYIGDGKFVHFSSFKKRLAIDSLYEHYFKTHFIGARRVIGSKIVKYLCKKPKD